MPSGWSLAGGNLVRLHMEERGSDAARSTRDIDVILDIRAEPWSITSVVAALRQSRFEPDGLNPAGHDHRWVRGDVGALYGKCSALLVSLDLSKDRHLSDIAALAAVVGPSDRRELLKLRRRERRRIIHGLTRAMGSGDVSDSQRQVLGRLSALLTSSLDAVQTGPAVDGDTSPRRR